MIDNPRVAATLLCHCASQGVREYCLAAGARNAPLALALLRASETGDIRIFHFFDERSAGFFALGRSLATRRPVAVVTTSGTAVAELLPAMVEAHYQSVPLVALTADRPAHYRGSGAPQAIEQPGIFGPYAPTCEFEGGGGLPPIGSVPIHINIPLDEPTAEVSPLEIALGSDLKARSKRLVGIDEAGRATLERFLEKGELVVAVGSLHPEEAPSVGSFLQRLRAPVRAEPASNLGGHPALLGIGFMGSERGWGALACQAKRILRIGGVPVARWWRDLENTDQEILNLCPSGYPGISRPCESVRVGDFSGLGEVNVGRADGGNDLSPDADPIWRFSRFAQSEPSLIRALSGIIPAGEAVFLGNSLPIRDWELAALPPKEGTVFFANRGANGIDGALSTALGAGADYPGIWAVLGDLTALYDLSGPWILPQLTGRPKVRIAVINNGGGRIFSHLPALSGLAEGEDAVIQNRHDLRFGAWAEMWGLAYECVRSQEDVEALLSAGIPDRVVLDIVPDAEETASFWREYRAG